MGELPSPFGTQIGFASAVPADLASAGFSQFDREQSMAFGEKRRQEFLLGRTAARRALLQIHWSGAAALAVTDSGQPLWPEGILGSIAHKRDIAVSAAATVDKVWALGLDIEEKSARAVRLLSRIASEVEQRWVFEDEAKKDLRAMLLFSTKESIYKALYPRCRRYFSFHAVRIEPAGASTLRVTLLEELSGELPAGFSFESVFVETERYLVTGVALR